MDSPLSPIVAVQVFVMDTPNSFIFTKPVNFLGDYWIICVNRRRQLTRYIGKSASKINQPFFIKYQETPSARLY
jgi:hypothetical protein